MTTLWSEFLSLPYFNELFNLNLKFKKIKSKYEKDEDDLKTHF